jgi:hypothetical protein
MVNPILLLLMAIIRKIRAIRLKFPLLMAGQPLDFSLLFKEIEENTIRLTLS